MELIEIKRENLVSNEKYVIKHNIYGLLEATFRDKFYWYTMYYDHFEVDFRINDDDGITFNEITTIYEIKE